MKTAFIAALFATVSTVLQLKEAPEPVYKNPFAIAISPAGDALFVVSSGTDSVIVLDASEGTVQAEIDVGDFPTSVHLDAERGVALVTNRDSDSLSVIDLERLQVIDTIAVGWAPMDSLVNPRTGRILVANSQSRDVSVVELETATEIKRLRGGDGPRGLVVGAAGRDIYLANLLPGPHPPSQPPAPEVTVIDAEREVVIERIGLEGANLVFGIDAAPDGTVLLALSRPKNLLPLIQVAGGWTMTGGVGLVRRPPGTDIGSSVIAQLLLDTVNRYHSEPTDIAVDRSGQRVAVTAGGANEVVIVDLEAMVRAFESTEPHALERLGDRLDLASRYVIGVVPTGRRPVAVALSPDGRQAYTANQLDDSVTVVDMKRAEAVATFDLGGPREISQRRRGERLFFDAGRSFNAQISCGSCHPDSNQDGLVYDISPDGLGRNYVDTRTMLGVGGTGPFKWSGLNPSLHRQCGPRAALFIFRSMGFSPEELDDVVAYMWSLELPRNRNLDSSGELNALQKWGQEIFKRTVDNNGETIPPERRCGFCHSGNRFTNLLSTDVGSASESDTSGSFDTPSLNHLPETAPYLHDGRAMTLEELWTVFSPEDTHGRALDLSKDELNALVEYLKCL